MTKQTLACLLAFLVLCAMPHAVPAASPASPQALQGTWVCSNGQHSMTFTFQGDSCTLRVDSMQMAGRWILSGTQLRVQFQNGSTQSWHCAMAGADLVLDGNMRFRRQGMPPLGPNGTGQQSPLEGAWTAQIPQGQMVFQFQGGRYASFLNGQPIEEGTFAYFPDGRLQFQVTAGRNAGQRGENRIVMQGQSFSMYGPNGAFFTFTRMTAPQPQVQPGPGATPIEGRWIFARSGPVSFGYVFSGSRFVYFINGAQQSSGTFQLTGYQITFRHDSGQTASFRYQLWDNRLVIFTSEDPNADPIPFVRQQRP